jgi:hypothetical protein
VSEQDSRFAVQPPWIEYPDSEPAWGGWRQGTSEAWLHDVWLPFWRRLPSADRAAYLKRWPPPNEDWELYVTRFWK